ncbi:DUF3396 domain-containing protein [Parasulfuritortus cantonensis]|uniref:DUF3396 domain-containing protein n=1 Tax=Parasulfuritortus cantonensis TaxID=2528202 RepID=A0A4R1BCN2_9PROT|nr:type VI immunity family protein [Parasulfuritortus cantonensis]TCJ14774.1 DUF3396 domain-containing protein [Parasulfuritortus cantonensis]
MEDLSKLETNLVLREDDGTVGLRLGLIFTAYFRKGYTQPVREAVMEALALWLETVSGQVNWVLNPKTEKWRRFKPEMHQALSQWLEQLPSCNEWSIAFHGGETNLDASAVFFRALAGADWNPDKKDLDHVRLGLPLTWYAGHKGSFPEFCRALCAILRPISGYGGIGFAPANGDMLATRFESAQYLLAQRFPGIEMDEPITHSQYIGDDIKGVNWLTVLGEALVERFGGQDKLAADLPPAATLLPYAGGVIVQSGPRPQLGDTAAGRMPMDYVAVNAVLKPLRATNTRAFHHYGPDTFTRAAALAWLTRFD